MPKQWMSRVANKIKASGTKGVFSSAAHRAGKSTAEFSREHLHDKGKLGKRARLAAAFASARH